MTGFGGAESRLLCVLLTIVLAWVAYRNPRRQGLLLLAVILCGVVNVLLMAGPRMRHSNLGHYYLGAKYPCGYFDFYRMITAARGLPQVGYRDLHRPDRMVGADPREQRLYYIGLLSRGKIAFPPSASLQELTELCRSRRLVEQEAVGFSGGAPAGQRAGALQRDLTYLELDTDDQGFNGSPFYVLVRQLDPSLYFPAGQIVFWSNLAWQFLALGLAAWLCRGIFGWSGANMLLVIALMLADWDYAGWSLNGLVTGGWLLPVVVALWGLHRGRPLVAGAGIAWAGLIKLFPFAMTLPLLLIVGREALFRERADSSGPARDEGRVSPPVRLALLTLAGTIVSAGALGAASPLSGYAWSEFLAKITTQFHYAGATGNGVGLSRLLMSLGIDTHAPLLPVQATALFVVVWMFWRPPAAVWWEGLPRRTLILLACMVWLSRKYMNYYGIVGLLLVPTLLGRNRLVTVMILLLHALSFAMPEFNVLYPGALVFLTAVKVAPYWALPLAALWQEMRGDRDPAPGPRGRVADAVFRRGAALTACGIFVSAAATGWEIWRWERAAASFAEGQRFLQEERSVEARAALVTSVRWRPSHALAQYSLGLAYERLGNRRDAARHYRLAVDADPDLTLARLNLGVLCVESGNLPEALQQFREAVRRAPYDESAHFDLGLALASHGDTGEARRHFAEALRIKPDFAAARERLGPADP